MAEPAAVLTFREAQERLLAQVRARMRNGELTERALARRLGVSQSHINNVLRGRRNLSHELADAILKFFHYSLLDLDHAAEPQTIAAPRFTVEVLNDPIGPGYAWSTLRNGGSRCYAPCPLDGVPECLVMVRVTWDERMSSVLHGYDIVLVDTSVSARLTDSPMSVYVVQRGFEAALRWIRGGFRSLYLVDEKNLNRPVDWERIPMREDQRLELVKGRALWIGSEAALRA